MLSLLSVNERVSQVNAAASAHKKTTGSDVKYQENGSSLLSHSTLVHFRR